MNPGVYPSSNRALVHLFVLQCLVLTFVQKETTGTLLSPLGMAFICLQSGLS